MPIWRDRVVLVCAVLALALVVIGIAGALTTPAALPPARGDVVALAEVDELRGVLGRSVVADGAEVESVPADEGFWVRDHSERAWVQLMTAGESPFVVRPGQRVSFTGLVVAHGPDFAIPAEFPAADARALIDAGAHVEVPVRDVRVWT